MEKQTFDELVYQPVTYESIKNNYQPRHAKRKPQFSDNSLAVGGIVVAVIVTFLTILAVVVSL